MMPPDLGHYCRALETHLCQVNEGHLVRIVGTAFDLVRRWHAEGLPLKIALRGIDRRAARAARVASASRRPLRLEFCEADVLDVFGEWRRAIGFALRDVVERDDDGEPGIGAESLDSDDRGGAAGLRPASLPKHLERVALRLTSFLASEAAAGPELRARVTAALDAVARLRESGRVRGDARRAALDELGALDDELLGALLEHGPDGWLDEAREEARQDLAAYASRVPSAEFARLVDRAARRLLRVRLQLPDVRLV